jgi:hypothetical protein
MCVPIFKQIASLLAWVERWKVRDFVCKKVGIEWDWELSGELRYVFPVEKPARSMQTYSGTGKRFIQEVWARDKRRGIRV